MFPLLVILIFILGAAFGSFASVIIYRLHSEETGIFSGRSHCAECKVPLVTLDLVPLVSYITLRGRCRYCSKPISYMYPLLELIMGTLFVVMFMKFPFVNSLLQLSEVNLGLFLLYCFYSFILVCTFFYDLRYRHVSDALLLPAICIGLIATIAAPLTPHILDALLGAAIGIIFFGAQLLVSKGRWIGEGDLRVVAFMGVILGWKLLIVALILSYLIGSVVGVIIGIQQGHIRGIKIPFAPFLVTGTFIAMFYGQEIMQWYLGRLGIPYF